MKKITKILSLGMVVFASNVALAGIDCTKFAGTWSGVCTRSGGTPATVNANANLIFNNDCTQFNPTGVPLVAGGNLTLNTQLGTGSVTTNVGGQIIRSENTRSVHENIPSEEYVHIQGNNGLNVLTSGANFRTITNITSKFNIRGNGQLRVRTRFTVDTYNRGVAGTPIDYTQICDLNKT